MTTRLLLLLALCALGRLAAAETKPGAKPAVAPAPVPVTPSAKTPPPVAPTASRRSAAVPATPAGPSFDTYRLIGERNIFDANRRGRSRNSDDVAPPRNDVISLVGTMDSDKGVLAFFDGTESGFRKALRVGQSVEKYKVAKITPDVVDLERDGQTISMRVSAQLRRPPGGEWKLISPDIARAEAAAAAAEAARSSAASSAPPPIPADASEALRRLMERRQKELKQ